MYAKSHGTDEQSFPLFHSELIIVYQMDSRFLKSQWFLTWSCYLIIPRPQHLPVVTSGWCGTESQTGGSLPDHSDILEAESEPWSHPSAAHIPIALPTVPCLVWSDPACISALGTLSRRFWLFLLRSLGGPFYSDSARSYPGDLNRDVQGNSIRKSQSWGYMPMWL